MAGRASAYTVEKLGLNLASTRVLASEKKFKKARQAIPKLPHGIDERGQYAIYKAGRGLNTEIYYRSMTPDKTTEGQTTLNKKKKKKKNLTRTWEHVRDRRLTQGVNYTSKKYNKYTKGELRKKSHCRRRPTS